MIVQQGEGEIWRNKDSINVSSSFILCRLESKAWVSLVHTEQLLEIRKLILL